MIGLPLLPPASQLRIHGRNNGLPASCIDNIAMDGSRGSSRRYLWIPPSHPSNAQFPRGAELNGGQAGRIEEAKQALQTALIVPPLRWRVGQSRSTVGMQKRTLGWV
jgi:hypothetical protein